MKPGTYSEAVMSVTAVSTKLVPGVSVIRLSQKSGVFSMQLTRYWTSIDGRVWYRLVLRCPNAFTGRDTVIELPCPRIVAAQLLSAEQRIARD